VNVKMRAREIDQYAALLTSGEPVLVEGKVSFPQRAEDEVEEPEGPREPTILLYSAKPLAEAVRADVRAISIRFRADRARAEQLAGLARVLTAAKGPCPVALHVGFEGGAEVVLSLGESWRVDVSDTLLSGIERVFGEQVAELR
jgi:DNA polymerase-3 subunit alpha